MKTFSFRDHLRNFRSQKDIEKWILLIFITILLNGTTGKLFIWLGGGTSINQCGSYGEKGVPDINNFPGARQAAVKWMDSNKNLYMFGGWGYGGVDCSTVGMKFYFLF